MRNLFIIAADDHNMGFVESLSKPLNCRFHRLIGVEDVQPSGGGFRFADPLARCREQLERFDDSIDGIMGWWDFPVSTMLAVLRERYGLPGASTDAVLRCEHKYLSRLVQREVVPEMVPSFVAVDPFDDRGVGGLQDEPGFPFWIKPIKAHSSQLGFRVEDGDDLERAIGRIRSGIAGFGDPFDEALAYGSDLPDEARRVRGHWCLAEGMISGHQVTLEGYVHQGQVTIPTVVDSVLVEGSSSFARYQYPSKLPDAVRSRMRERVAQVMIHHGYDDATFNVELYWDEEQERMSLLEINPRASQSHTVITDMVDGIPHLEAMAALALGEPPAPHLHSRGRWKVAAKFFVRVAEDARVVRVPKGDAIAFIEEELGGQVEVDVREGNRLSDLKNQDSYSYAMATVHLGAESERALLDKYERCLEMIDLELERDGQRVEQPDYLRGGLLG